MLDGILWILRTGAPWHDLPERYLPYQTCHRRFQTWVEEGTLSRILEALAEDLKERGGLDLSECICKYSTTSEIEHYQSDYPALYRVLYAVNYVFIQITRHYRGKVRDVNEWRRAVRLVFKRQRARINSPQELQSYIVVYFVITLVEDRKRYFHAEIGDHLEIFNLVAKAYMANPNDNFSTKGNKSAKKTMLQCNMSLPRKI